MRSFLEYVSCWATTPEVSMSEEVVMAATPARKDETKSLMPPNMAAPRKKNRIRVRVGTTGSMNQQWKPSLCVITEDNVMAEKREKTQSKATTTTVDRVVKRKSTAGSRSKVHVRSYSNNMGRNPVPVVLHTFSPTTFMF